MSDNNYTIPQLKYVRDLINIIAFIKSKKKSPSNRTDDNHELLLAKDLGRLRDAHRCGRLPKECYDLARSSGNIDIFTTLATNELIGLTNIQNIVAFKELNNKYPSLRSTDTYEYALAIKHNNLKASFRGRGGLHWYESYMDEAIKLNHTDMFDSVYNIESCVQYMTNILQYYTRVKKLPTATSPIQITHELGKQLSYLKLMHSKNKLPKKCYDMANRHSLNDMFAPKVVRTSYIRAHSTEEKDRYTTINKCIKFIKKYDRLPAWRSNIPYERKLAYKLRYFKRMHKNGKLDTKYIHYASIRGMPDLFEYRINVG